MTLGGIAGMISQYPLGWLADRINRVLLIFILIASSMFCPLLLPYCLEMTIPGLMVIFFWGVASTGIYTMGTILLGERFRGAQLAGAMDLFGPDGLAYTMIALYALVLPVVTWTMLHRQPPRQT